MYEPSVSNVSATQLSLAALSGEVATPKQAVTWLTRQGVRPLVSRTLAFRGRYCPRNFSIFWSVPSAYCRLLRAPSTSPFCRGGASFLQDIVEPDRGGLDVAAQAQALRLDSLFNGLHSRLAAAARTATRLIRSRSSSIPETP